MQVVLNDALSAVCRDVTRAKLQIFVEMCILNVSRVLFSPSALRQGAGGERHSLVDPSGVVHSGLVYIFVLSPNVP